MRRCRTPNRTGTRSAQYTVEIVHLGNDKTRLNEAIEAGVQSVPATVLDGGIPLHINFGAFIKDLL